MYENDGRWRAFWRWLGHYSDHIGMVACIGGALVVGATAVFKEALGHGGAYVLMVVWSVYFIAYAARDRHMCPRCVTDESALLDPEAAITRRRRELAAFHSGRRRRSVPLALALVGVGLLYVLPQGAARSTAYVGTFLIQGAISAYMMFVYNVHRRLQPWCPHCRRGGRGPRGFMIPDPTNPPVVKPQPQTT